MRCLHLRDDLLDRERVQVDRGAHRHNEQPVFDTKLEELESGQRREEHLGLVRVLREPLEVRAAVDEALRDLEHHGRRRLILGGVALGLMTLGGRRRKAVLDAATCIIHPLVAHLLGHGAARDAAVDRLNFRELTQLEHRRVDHVQRRRVQVAQRVARDAHTVFIEIHRRRPILLNVGRRALLLQICLLLARLLLIL